MKFNAMTNTAIAAEIGQRLEQLRLERNTTQEALANEIGITPKSYRQLIAGGGKFENIIAALRALNALHHLENFIPSTVFSPLEQLTMRGNQRQRARSKHHSEHQDDSPGESGVRESRLDW